MIAINSDNRIIGFVICILCWLMLEIEPHQLMCHTSQTPICPFNSWMAQNLRQDGASHSESRHQKWLSPFVLIVSRLFPGVVCRIVSPFWSQSLNLHSRLLYSPWASMCRRWLLDWSEIQNITRVSDRNRFTLPDLLQRCYQQSYKQTSPQSRSVLLKRFPLIFNFTLAHKYTFK